MANFDQAFERTIGIEGTYSGDPNDNGNWTGGVKDSGILVGTMYGISAPVLRSYLGRLPNVTDMRTLKLETAKSIYRSSYWNEIKGDDIEYQDTANYLFDMAVNQGTETAIKLTQRTLGLHETGNMDSITLLAINNQA